MKSTLTCGVVLWSLVAMSPTQAQKTETTVGTAKLLQADYAVPDAPALKMIDADASMLLRPVSVRALTAALSSASGDFSFIPRAFAVEVAPFMLPRAERLTLADYKKRRFLYRTRMSVATKRDTGAVARTQMAIGFRWSLDDDSDLRTNEQVYRTLLALTNWQLDSAEEVKTRWAAAGIPRTGPRPGQPGDVDKARLIERQVAEKYEEAGRRLVEAAKAAQEEALWNASVLDVAVGMSGSSADSTAVQTRADGYAAWVTKGWKVGKDGQLLFGGRGAWERLVTDSEFEATGDAAVRFYLGTNRYKAFGEFQGTGRASVRPIWLGKLGGELQVADTFWFDASVGYEAVGSTAGRVVSSVKAKFTPPGS